MPWRGRRSSDPRRALLHAGIASSGSRAGGVRIGQHAAVVCQVCIRTASCIEAASDGAITPWTMLILSGRRFLVSSIRCIPFCHFVCQCSRWPKCSVVAVARRIAELGCTSPRGLGVPSDCILSRHVVSRRTSRPSAAHSRRGLRAFFWRLASR